MNETQILEIGKRYEMIIAKEGLNAKKFAEAIGVSSTNIYSILDGKSKPGFETIEKTIKKFPKYKDFIILGTGDIYNLPGDTNNSFGDEIAKGLEKLFREQLAIKDEQIAKKDEQINKKDEQLAIKDQHISTLLLNFMPLGKDDLSGASLRVTYKREMGRVMPLGNFLVTSPLTVGHQ